MAGIRNRHPDYAPRQVTLALARLVLGDDLTRQVWPHEELAGSLTVEEEALLRVARALEREAIPYMVTGSFASSYHGRPRATHDADLVVDPEPGPARQARAPPRRRRVFPWTGNGPSDALRRRRQFNVIEIETGWKIDLIIRKERPFSRTELAAPHDELIWPANAKVAIASPEDTILSKLEWARESGGSEKQLADVLGDSGGQPSAGPPLHRPPSLVSGISGERP